MPTPRDVAEAFSAHRFRDCYDALAPDVRWTPVGAADLVGRAAVVEVCDSLLSHLATVRTEVLRSVTVAEGDAVVVDAVVRYTDADDGVSVVSSCDIYVFSDGAVTAITSYTVELDPASVGPAGHPTG